MKELLEKILGQIKKTPSGVRAYEDLYHICLETQKTNIPLSVEYLKKLIQEKTGISEFLVNYVGPTIGAHSGPGTLAVFFVGQPR